MNMIKRSRLIMCLLFAVAGLIPCDGRGDDSGYTVTNITVRQRWPWSKKVDIDFSVQMPEGGDPDRTVDLFITGTDGAAPVTLNWASLSGDIFGVMAGDRHIVWNPEVNYKGKTFTRFDVEFNVQTSKTAYMIVDLQLPVGDPGQITYRYGAWNDVTNSVYKTSKLVFRRIPATTSEVWRVMSDRKDYFTSGSPASEVERTSSREALVKIKLTRDYWMAVFELTQAQLGYITNGFANTAPEYPVAVKYEEMRGTFAQGINSPTTGTNVAPASVLTVFRQKTGLVLDLPTEAQWEYACRAGTATPFYDGAFKEAYTTSDYDASMLTLGRFKLNGNSVTTVGRYQPNAWGLYDMHGNAGEYCLNRMTDNINPGSAEYLVDPVGPARSGPYWDNWAVRGGTANIDSTYCRSASRSYSSAAYAQRLTVPAKD